MSEQFEAEGIVERCVSLTTPVTIEYRLTDKDRALESAVRELSIWAGTWLPVGNQSEAV